MKDDKSVINTVAWRGVAGKLSFNMEDGLEVIATGRISTYGARSNYQLIVEKLEPAGIGALMALLEKRKAELQKEGLFDQERKKELPYLPKVIGVVTSPTGAVIRDILHRITDRFPVHVLVWPVLVQGEGAKEQIAEAIRGFDALEEGGAVPRPDVVIVARGGGSLEDLWAFNEEIVARAAAECSIPLISAVGHETDTTLIDFVSDKRAPTPTAAAEMAVPVKAELVGYVMDLRSRLHGGMQRMVTKKADRLEAYARGLTTPKRMLENMEQRLDDWSERLQGSLPKLLKEKEQKFSHASEMLRPALILRDISRLEERVEGLGRLLESSNYTKILKRGFAMVRDAKDEVLTSAAAISSGAAISLEFSDGRVAATAGGKPSVPVTPTPKPKPKPKKKAPKVDERQESLF
jgi:exodeoxyribonuclease VII large subunit